MLDCCGSDAAQSAKHSAISLSAYTFRRNSLMSFTLSLKNYMRLVASMMLAHSALVLVQTVATSQRDSLVSDHKQTIRLITTLYEHCEAKEASDFWVKESQSILSAWRSDTT